MPRYISPQPQYFTDLGLPLTGGKLYFYEPSTLVPKNTYSNTALTIANSNPIILATNGSPPTDIWLNGVYRVRLFDAIGNLIWDKDPVGGDSGSLIAYSDWASGIEYPVGKITTGSNGRYYVAILSPNIGQNPVSSPVYWSEVPLLRIYNANETYPAGNVALHNGYLWKAKVSTAGSTPALGSAFWEPAVDGLDELQRLSSPTNISGTVTLAKSMFYRITDSDMKTLPAAATAAVNEPIYLTKDPVVTPTVQAQVGEKIRIGKDPSATLLYDNFLYNANSTITLVSDGAEWELM